MSYTLARLPVPRPLWDLIAAKLRAAGYDHVFHEGMIDMTHIGLEVDPAAKGWAEILAEGLAASPAIASGLAPVFEPTTLGAALTDPRVLRGQRWIRSRIATSIGTAAARFEAWQFRVTDGMAETRFYNPDRETADGISIGWRPWRPARDFGIEQLRQPATIIEPTESTP